MAVVQLCVQMRKEAGTIQQLTEVLKMEGINILAISVSSREEDVFISMVVDDPEMAGNIFETKGLSFTKDEVIIAELPEHPGGLHAVFTPLKAAQINLLQCYSFLTPYSSQALLVIHVDRVKEAVTALEKNWIHLVGEDVYGN